MLSIHNLHAAVEESAPFPLEGGRVGDGGGDGAEMNSASKSHEPEGLSENGEGATPTPNPSPLQGAGKHPDRLPHGPVAGGVARARRLRKEMTLAERLLWAELRKLRMNFRRQVPIGRYVADFACLSSRLIIEVDGYHHTTSDGSARDAERDAWFTAEGYCVLRIPEAEVRHRLREVVERIAAETAPPPSPTLPPSRGKGDARYSVR
jgi:very-short-patch-repair endonuclease